MRIVFDHQIFSWQKQGGISRYYAELIRHASATKGVDVQLSLINTFNKHLQAIGLKNNLLNKLLSNNIISRSRFKKYTDRLNQAYAVSVIKKQQFDVFIPTYFDTYFLPYLQKKPFVLTVYDMIHELYPENFGNNRELADNKGRLIRSANRIIAISQNTKNDILKFYPQIDPLKIQVVHLSHSIEVTDTLPKITLPQKYILFVGERRGYKNFEFFIRAAAHILQPDPELHVLCVGGDIFSNEEKTMFEELKITRQMIQYTASDPELYGLYNRALVFVFPSLYEGFGIPVLEAMASGCPVLLCRASSFPEVASDAAVYFKAGDENELSVNLAKLIGDKALRELYVKKGFENVQRFSWKKTAEQCLSVFRSASM